MGCQMRQKATYMMFVIHFIGQVSLYYIYSRYHIHNYYRICHIADAIYIPMRGTPFKVFYATSKKAIHNYTQGMIL